MGKRGKEKKSNITDNKSSKMQTSRGMIQGYNGQAMVDEKHQIILAAEAFGTGPEQELFTPMVKNTKENLMATGKTEKAMEGIKLLTDTGYFSEDNLKKADEEKIDAYIPDQQYRKRDPMFETAKEHKSKKATKYTKEDFIYNEETDTFTCPNKKLLVLEKKNARIKVFEGDKYKARQADCSKCLKRKNCLKLEHTRHRTLFILKKKYLENYSEAMVKKIDTEKAREIHSKRMGIVEPVFGNITYQKNMNRFTLRGKEKVNIQWLLYSLVHNIEKITNFGWDRYVRIKV